MPPIPTDLKSFIGESIKNNPVTIFAKTTCPFCKKIKQLFTSLGLDYHAVDLDTMDNGADIQATLLEMTGQKTVPNVFIKGKHIGGFDDTSKLHAEGKLVPLVKPSNQATPTDLKAFIEETIRNNVVTLFAKTFCPFCKKLKELLTSIGVSYHAVELNIMENGAAIQATLHEMTGQKTVPNVFINGKHIGGFDDTTKLHTEGKLLSTICPSTQEYEYDMVVIGGGSGGLACSKEASKYGKKVAVLDFVEPTPTGTTWGLGGTCVNVGCIPKKLMHQTALLGGAIKDAKHYGWQVNEEQVKHDWQTMKEAVQNYIGSLNFGYRVALRDKGIKYLNAKGELMDQHRIKTTNSRGKVVEITAETIVVATGERPRYPDIPGAKELAITSDDLFSLPYCPGKTLVIGASYVALECAGFLAGIGLDVTVMQMATIVGGHMETEGVKFIKKHVPVKIEQLEDGEPKKLKVTYKSVETGEIFDGEYNTVLFGIGRDSCTKGIGLENAGVKVNEKNSKVFVNEKEQTNISNIYALGDILHGKLELTPVAIEAGFLLARRLYAGSNTLCDYVNVPTTVFTPLEYSCCGYSEEMAYEKFGDDNIEVYHTNLWPLEWTVASKDNNICYAKLICNKNDNFRVVGIHIASPNAGEVMQGYACAIKCGATKTDFDRTIGIHPTIAEVFTTMAVTKSSGEDITQAGC